MNALRFFAVAVLSLAVAGPAFAKSASRTRLLTAPNPSRVGETVVMTAEVDGLGDGAPTGSVTFKDGVQVLGSSALSLNGAGQSTLAAGNSHSCALTKAGGVECWGGNLSGQLGDGTLTSRSTRVAVSGLASGVVAVAAKVNQTCALTLAGAVHCWGAVVGSRVPVAVPGLSSGVVAIATGQFHICALTSGGAVKCLGDNSAGQLGDGTTTNRPSPVPVSGLSRGVVAITAGSFHSCALTGAGAVKCWGSNFTGELGDGTIVDRLAPVVVSGLSSGVVAIAAGHTHSCALLRTGAVKCWGSNQSGKLGDGTTTTRLTPVAVSGLSTGVAAITAGALHSCAVKGSGGARCWGSNVNGAIGDGTTVDRATPVAVSGLSSGVVAIVAGGFHSCALTRAGAARCWGANGFGAIGDGTTTGRPTPTAVLGFAGLVRARAKLGVRTLSVGAHTLRATYPGDALHLSSSGPRSQTVK
jgi:alpha-tubulin suppressor-like RCC1 family protein